MGTLRLRLFFVAFGLVAALAGQARAQDFTGRVDITVKDAGARPLPGVRIEITGSQPASGLTDNRGVARFIHLTPGRLTIIATLQGFVGYRNDQVSLTTGSTVVLNVTLRTAPAGPATDQDDSARTVDLRKHTESTNISADDLARLPWSRDVWGLLTSVPSIAISQVIVGSSDAGQQPAFFAKGAAFQDNTWSLDGIAISDPRNAGLSATYYDVDMFQDVHVTTGGASVKSETAGVHTNLVLRSGTNTFSGQGRFYFSGDSLEGNGVPRLLIAQIRTYRGLRSSYDAGAQLGGPLSQGRLFWWGAYGRTETSHNIFSYEPTTYPALGHDKTTIENAAAKLTRVGPSTREALTYFHGGKLETGRDLGPARPEETTLREKAPTDLLRVELARSLFGHTSVDVRYAHTRSRVSLEPRGGRDAIAYLSDAGVWHNTYQFQDSRHPQDAVAADAVTFWHGHEFAWGAEVRRAAVDVRSGWPGGHFDLHEGYPILFADLAQDPRVKGHAIYSSAYASDAIRWGRLTLDVGVRWDHQAGSVDAANVDANPVRPALLPAASVSAQSNVIVWNTVTPRLNAALLLTDKTVLRGSYGEFATQLGAGLAAALNGLPMRTDAFVSVADRNANKIFDGADTSAFLGTDTSNTKVGGYLTPRTREAVVSLDREFGSSLIVSAAYTYRLFTDFNWLHFAGVTASDFVRKGTLSGTSTVTGDFSVPFYVVNASAVPNDLLRIYEGRPGYTQDYQGFEIGITTTFARGWMLRASGAGGAHREYFDSADAAYDPTPIVPSSGLFSLDSANLSSGAVVREPGLSDAAIFMITPRYQAALSASGSLFSGITIGINYRLRQGYGMPYFRSNVTGSADVTNDRGKDVLVDSDIEQHRLPDVHMLDVRLSRPVRAFGQRLTIDVDVFNVLNRATPLARDYDLRSPSFNTVQAIPSPRVIRAGVRWVFGK